MQTQEQIRDKQARTLLNTIQHNVIRSKNDTAQLYMKIGDLTLLLSLLGLYLLPPEPTASEDPDRSYLEARMARLIGDAAAHARNAKFDADNLIWLDDRPAGYFTTAQIRTAARALATATAALLDAGHALHGDINPH